MIEPELTYRYVGGIGAQARNVLLFDTTDIATDVNEAGFSLTQRFYLRPTDGKALQDADGDDDEDARTARDAGRTKPDAQRTPARNAPREWATWQIAQEYFIDPNFGGALIPGRRNVFDVDAGSDGADISDFGRATLRRSSRACALRPSIICASSGTWTYDTIARTIRRGQSLRGVQLWPHDSGIGHALLNAVDERISSGSPTRSIKSQQLQPFLEFGKPSGNGFNLAVNGGYDFVQHQVQYAGVQAVYNWNCCGLTLGYRRFELGNDWLDQPRRDAVALQLYAGQLRRGGRHPARQFGLPRSDAAAGVLETGSVVSGQWSGRHRAIHQVKSISRSLPHWSRVAFRPAVRPSITANHALGCRHEQPKPCWSILS